jgi:MoaA/NifB/PqqE/SkfB family radical SAM enzyme
MLLSVRHRCAIPRALLMDPTSRCNLRCTGCWASGYQRDDLPFELMDRILTEAESLRVRYCFLSGGEPLIRKDDLLSLIEKHPRISFCAYTNGLLIDEAFADRMTELGNLSVSLSLEGFREQTDARRGPGVYDRVMETMDLLRQRGLSFSFSACYHSGNYETVSSDAFLDWMREKGCGAAGFSPISRWQRCGHAPRMHGEPTGPCSGADRRLPQKACHGAH